MWLQMALVSYDKEIASEALATALSSSSPDPVRINTQGQENTLKTSEFDPNPT